MRVQSKRQTRRVFTIDTTDLDDDDVRDMTAYVFDAAGDFVEVDQIEFVDESDE